MIHPRPEPAAATWVASLTPTEVAAHLRRISQDQHCLDRDERTALLDAAATLIDPTSRRTP